MPICWLRTAFLRSPPSFHPSSMSTLPTISIPTDSSLRSSFSSSVGFIPSALHSRGTMDKLDKRYERGEEEDALADVARWGGPTRCQPAHWTREKMLLWGSSKMFLFFFFFFFFPSLPRFLSLPLFFFLKSFVSLFRAGLWPAREEIGSLPRVPSRDGSEGKSEELLRHVVDSW